MVLKCVSFWLWQSGSYFHFYDGLQGLGFAWILMQLISPVQLLKEKESCTFVSRLLDYTLHNQYLPQC